LKASTVEPITETITIIKSTSDSLFYSNVIKKCGF
jgi:hypothetical protein